MLFSKCRRFSNSLDQVKAWVADFQIRNTAARMNEAALESAMARFDAGLVEFLDRTTAAAARRGDGASAADATDADAAAEARLRESFPHLPTLSSLRWRGLISNCFLTDVDPEDTDDADILMNYQLELKGSREVGASTATAPGGISAAGADERNIEYIVRVSTADMAWTCYRCVLSSLHFPVPLFRVFIHSLPASLSLSHSFRTQSLSPFFRHARGHQNAH
jgi:hypothetical protein